MRQETKRQRAEKKKEKKRKIGISFFFTVSPSLLQSPSYPPIPNSPFYRAIARRLNKKKKESPANNNVCS